MKFATLLSAGLMLAPCAQASERESCLAVADLALRAASAAEAGVSLTAFAESLPPSVMVPQVAGIVMIAYGIYLLGDEAPRQIAWEIYSDCMGEDA